MSAVAQQRRKGLATAIDEFIAYKRALNRSYETEAAALRLLGRAFANEASEDLRTITPAMIEAFLRSRPRCRPRSYNHLLGVVRRFFDWTVLQGLIEHNPAVSAPRRRGSPRRPYVFDVDEMRRLLAIARALPDRPKAPHRGLVYETIFALLYGLGLRVGEVCRLRLGDVDLERGILTIRDSKFGKSRLVPFGPRLAERIESYIDERFASFSDALQPLFSFTTRGCVCTETITQTFHALWPRLGLVIPAGVSAPRLHDLRHSFAVGTLLRWYREGVDPNQRLLHLSTFLGHVSPTTTAVYLTITDQLLAQADVRFRTHAWPRISRGVAP
jgi:integrase